MLSNGYYSTFLNCGMTDKPGRAGCRGTIYVYVNFRLHGGAIDYLNTTITLGRRHYEKYTVEQIDALMENLATAKRHRRWRTIREFLLRYGGNTQFCPHEHADGTMEQALQYINTKVYRLKYDYRYKQREMPNTVYSRVLNHEEPYMTDDERELVKAGLEYKVNNGEDPSTAIPHPEWYELYTNTVGRRMDIRPDMNPLGMYGRVCPQCGHTLGSSWSMKPTMNLLPILEDLLHKGSHYRSDASWNESN